MQQPHPTPSSRQTQPGQPGKSGSHFDGLPTPPLSSSSGQYAAINSAAPRPAQVELPKGATKASNLINIWNSRSSDAADLPKPIPGRIGRKLAPQNVVRQKIVDLGNASDACPSKVVRSRVAAFAKLSEANKNNAKNACLFVIQKRITESNGRIASQTSSGGSVRRYISSDTESITTESGENSSGDYQGPALAINFSKIIGSDTPDTSAPHAANPAVAIPSPDKRAFLNGYTSPSMVVTPLRLLPTPAPGTTNLGWINCTDMEPPAQSGTQIAESGVRPSTEFPEPGLNIIAPVPTRHATVAPRADVLSSLRGSDSSGTTSGCVSPESRRLYRELEQMTMVGSATRHFHDWHSGLPTVERHPEVMTPTLLHRSTLSVGVGSIPPIGPETGTARVLGTRRFRRAPISQARAEAQSACRVTQRLVSDANWRKGGAPATVGIRRRASIMKGFPVAVPRKQSTSALPIAKYYINSYNGQQVPKRSVSPSPTMSTIGSRRSFRPLHGTDGLDDGPVKYAVPKGRLRVYWTHLKKTTTRKAPAPLNHRLMRMPGYADGLAGAKTRRPSQPRKPLQTSGLQRGKLLYTKVKKIASTVQERRAVSAGAFPRIPKLRKRMPDEKTALWMDMEWPLGKRAVSY